MARSGRPVVVASISQIQPAQQTKHAISSSIWACSDSALSVPPPVRHRNSARTAAVSSARSTVRLVITLAHVPKHALFARVRTHQRPVQRSRLRAASSRCDRATAHPCAPARPAPAQSRSSSRDRRARSASPRRPPNRRHAAPRTSANPRQRRITSPRSPHSVINTITLIINSLSSSLSLSPFTTAPSAPARYPSTASGPVLSSSTQRLFIHPALLPTYPSLLPIPPHRYHLSTLPRPSSSPYPLSPAHRLSLPIPAVLHRASSSATALSSPQTTTRNSKNTHSLREL